MPLLMTLLKLEDTNLHKNAITCLVFQVRENSVARKLALLQRKMKQMAKNYTFNISYYQVNDFLYIHVL